MLVSIYITSMQPWRHVALADSPRAAQILARLLTERFPGYDFDFATDTGLLRPDCHPSIRDGALSHEVQRLVAAELVLEDAANPHGLPKWCAFQCRDGSVYANPDHHLAAIRACRADSDVVEERAFYGERPTPAEILDLFRDEEHV